MIVSRREEEKKKEEVSRVKTREPAGRLPKENNRTMRASRRTDIREQIRRFDKVSTDERIGGRIDERTNNQTRVVDE